MKSKRKKSNLFFNILIVIAACVFVFSGYMLFTNIIRGNKEQSVFDDMAAAVHTDKQTAVPEDANKLRLEQYSKLKAENEDFIGWLEIEDTLLDYPVMHTPDNSEYYLRRSFDKSYAISGTPFLDASCNTDSDIMLIYGHHMNNGTMFATLHSYAKKDFWESHREIKFDTTSELRRYEIVSAFYTEIKTTDDTESFKYYNYMGDVSEEDFKYYCDNIKAVSLYDTGVDIDADDKLLTLSTCSYHHEYGRFVLIAKLKDTIKP